MARKKTVQKYHVWFETKGLYSVPIEAASLDEALDKGRSLVSTTTVPEFPYELEICDEESRVTGVIE